MLKSSNTGRLSAQVEQTLPDDSYLRQVLIEPEAVRPYPNDTSDPNETLINNVSKLFGDSDEEKKIKPTSQKRLWQKMFSQTAWTNLPPAAKMLFVYVKLPGSPAAHNIYQTLAKDTSCQYFYVLVSERVGEFANEVSKYNKSAFGVAKRFEHGALEKGGGVSPKLGIRVVKIEKSRIPAKRLLKTSIQEQPRLVAEFVKNRPRVAAALQKAYMEQQKTPRVPVALVRSRTLSSELQRLFGPTLLKHANTSAEIVCLVYVRHPVSSAAHNVLRAAINMATEIPYACAFVLVSERQRALKNTVADVYGSTTPLLFGDRFEADAHQFFSIMDEAAGLGLRWIQRVPTESSFDIPDNLTVLENDKVQHTFLSTRKDFATFAQSLPVRLRPNKLKTPAKAAQNPPTIKQTKPSEAAAAANLPADTDSTSNAAKPAAAAANLPANTVSTSNAAKPAAAAANLPANTVSTSNVTKPAAPPTTSNRTTSRGKASSCRRQLVSNRLERHIQRDTNNCDKNKKIKSSATAAARYAGVCDLARRARAEKWASRKPTHAPKKKLRRSGRGRFAAAARYHREPAQARPPRCCSPGRI